MTRQSTHLEPMLSHADGGKRGITGTGCFDSALAIAKLSTQGFIVAIAFLLPSCFIDIDCRSRLVIIQYAEIVAISPLPEVARTVISDQHGETLSSSCDSVFVQPTSHTIHLP